jgi:biotin synthase
LGESEEDVVVLIQSLVGMGIRPILFAFTPVPGTRLESLSQPDLIAYRRIQVARYLIVHGYASYEEIRFKDGKITGFNISNLTEILSDGDAFRTTGCPGCNRPFYNERPSGPFYNYPREPTKEETRKELRELGIN